MDLTPRLNVPTPSEREEPYFATAREESLTWDAGVHANAENSQLQFLRGGVLGWDASAAPPNAGVLFWSEEIEVTAFSGVYVGKIAGPGSVELQDGEVLYFVMPRLMQSDQTITLLRSSFIALSPTRLFDLRLFAARRGDVLYFYNGKSLADGDQCRLFDGGCPAKPAVVQHTHHPPLVIEPGAAGVVTLDLLMTAPDLDRVELYRNGQLLAEPADYTVNLATGIVTLTTPTASPTERFVALRTGLDFAATTTNHTHLTPLVLNPAPGGVLLDMLVTAPLVDGIDLYRGGLLQAEPGDYTFDANTGFVTLTVPTAPGERFVALRRLKQ